MRFLSFERQTHARALALMLLSAGCSSAGPGATEGGDGSVGGSHADAAAADAEMNTDARVPVDAMAPDAPDSSAPGDASPPDSGALPDATLPTDAASESGVAPDSGGPSDAGGDATITDGGSSPPDATALGDAPPGDAGPADAILSIDAIAASDATGATDAAAATCSDPAAILQGSFTISNSVDVATLGAFCEVTGDVNLSAPGLTTISLPHLVKVDGVLNAPDGGVPALVSLSLPVLQHLGGLTVVAPQLTTFSAPQLASIGALNLSIPLVATLPFPALTSVGDINTALYATNHLFYTPSLDCPVLETAGKILIATPGSTLNAPKLFQATSLQLAGGCGANVPSLTVCPYVAVGTVVDLSTAAAQLNAPKLSSTSLALQAPMSALDLSGLTAAVGNLPSGNVNCALAIDPGVMPNLSLPIATIEGDICGAAGVTLPNLVSVSGGIELGEDAIAPRLASIGGGATIVPSDSLPALTSVPGNLVVNQGADAGAVSLPALKTAGAVLLYGATNLTGFSAPVLTTCSNDFSMGTTLRQLALLSAPNLTTIGGSFLANSLALTDFSFPMLATVGGTVQVASNLSITSFDLSGLTTLGGNFWLDNSPLLTSDLVFKKLASVGAIFHVTRTGTKLVSLPILASRALTLDLENNAALTRVDAPAIGSVGVARDAGADDMMFIASPNFPEACAQNIFDQAVARGYNGLLGMAGLGTGPCPY